MFGLIYEGVYNKDVVGTPAAMVNAPWNGWDILASALNCISLVLSMPVKSLPKQLVIEIGR